MGFGTDLFVSQPVDDNLICGLCLEVLDKPTSACIEGHIFCAACLAKVVDKRSCPTCRGSRQESLCRPIQNMVSSHVFMYA